ncbi:MAG: hypothetical protein JOZ05_25280 [Acetobacteraceae bacterium]|nr:hypothetical protein [Acetobacteraceae bacterium]
MSQPITPQKVARVAIALTAFLATSALAQGGRPAAPPPLSGTVETLQGAVLTVRSAQSGSVPVNLAPDVQVITQERVSVDAIKSGLFVGVTASEGKDGKLHASEVHIFPESMRGTGEGHYPWQGPPNTTMTNGNVVAAAQTMTNGNVQAAAGNGHSVLLHVGYKGGESDIAVGNDVPVTRMVVSGRQALRPGVPVLVFLARNPDDSATARMIVVNPGPPPK